MILVRSTSQFPPAKIPTRAAWLIEFSDERSEFLGAGKGSLRFDQLALRPDACVEHELLGSLQRNHLRAADRLPSQFCRQPDERCLGWKGDYIEDHLCRANQVFGKGSLIGLSSACHHD